MLSKAKIKELSSYKQAKYCDEANLFVVEGVKMADEALGSHFGIKCLCATTQWLRQHAELEHCDEVYEVSHGELERLSGLRTPNEVWMLLERTPVAAAAESPVTIVLDHLQDPGNLGTIMRTADWFGIRHIVCSPDTASCYNPKVVQASMGAIFRTTVEYTPIKAWLDSYPHAVYGATLDGDDLRCLQFQTPSALVVGNESKGISSKVREAIKQKVCIPNLGGTCESLNAANAAAILIAKMLI